MAFDTGTRRRIAQEWATSSLSQENYAAGHGISARTLREWVRVYGAGDRPVAKARAIVDDAIERLQALRTALDVEEAYRNGAVTAVMAPAEAEPERHAEPAVKLRVVPPLDDAPAVVPERKRGLGFFSSLD